MKFVTSVMRLPALPRLRATRMKAGIALFAGVALLSSCSAIKLGYNNFPTLAHTYLDSKVDFSPAQSAMVKEGLSRAVKWHRQNELPRLENELRTARAALATGPDNQPAPISLRQIETLNETLRASLRRTAEYAAPLIARTMMTLNAGQVAEIQQSLDDSNRKYREERLQADRSKRIEASAERMSERFERWLGRLSSGQQGRIRQWAGMDVQQAERHYQKRLQRQQRFVRLAQQAALKEVDETTLSRAIAALLNEWQTPDPGPEQQATEAREAATIQMVADVLNLANRDQRNQAAERAESWAEDFRILARNE